MQGSRGASRCTLWCEAEHDRNGFATGAATLLLIFWLAATTLTGALGFVGSTVAGLDGAVAPAAIEAVADQAAPAVDLADVQSAAEDPAAVVDEAVPENVEQQAEAATQQAEEVAGAVAGAAGPSAWGTFFAILLALAIASIGGMLGQAERKFVPGAHLRDGPGLTNNRAVHGAGAAGPVRRILRQ